jgi:hypothetical protein
MFDAVQTVPQAVQGGATAASLFTMAAAFLDQIHGPAATVGVILGAIWIGMQITNMAIIWIGKIRARRKDKQ